MATLGTLAVSVLGDARDLEKSFDGVNKKVEGFSKGMQDMGRRVGNTGKTMTKWVTGPILAVGAGVLALATKTGQFADELLDLEAATGISTDRLQQFRMAEVAAGVETDAIAESIMRMNRRMQDSDEYNARLTATAEKYGVALRDANGEVRGAEEVHHDLMMAIAAIEDPQERARAGAQAFGRDWEQIAPVVMLGREELERLYEQDVIDRDKLEQANEFRQSMDELKHAFSMAFMEAGTNIIPLLQDTLVPLIQDKIIPAIGTFVEWIARLIEWFTNLSPTVQKTIGIVIGLVTVLGPVLIVVGKIITAIGVIIPVVAKIIGVIKVVGGVIAAVVAGPIALIIAAIAAVIAIGVLLWKNWDTIKEKASQIWGAIRDFFSNLWERIKEIFSNAWEWIKDLFFKYHPLGWVIDNWEEVRDFFVNLWEGIKDFFSNIWGSIRGTAVKWSENVRDRVSSSWEGLRKNTVSTWERIKGFFERTWDSMRDVGDGRAGEIVDSLRDRFGWMFDFIQSIFGEIFDFYRQIWEAIKALFRGETDEAVEHVRSAYSGMFDFIRNIWNQIVGVIRQAWNNIVAAVRQQASNLYNAAVNAVQGVLNYIRGLPSTFRTMGQNMMIGMINGIRAMARRLIDAAVRVVNNAIDAAKRLLRLGSPSRLFMDFGENIAKGLAFGMERMNRMVEEAGEQMAQSAFASPQLSLQTPGASQINQTWNGEIRVRHEVDLRNVPDSVDGESLQTALAEMLNNPTIKRQIDRINYENKVSRKKGQGE